MVRLALAGKPPPARSPEREALAVALDGLRVFPGAPRGGVS